VLVEELPITIAILPASGDRNDVVASVIARPASRQERSFYLEQAKEEEVRRMARDWAPQLWPGCGYSNTYDARGARVSRT